MSDKYKVVQVDKPAWEIVGHGITEYNRQQAGDDNSQQLCFVLRDEDGAVIGGAIGIVYWEWLEVNLMWLPEAQRGKGYGTRLLALLEDAARERGAKHAFLDTFSFQAPGFYERNGYTPFGELAGFPDGHTRFYMQKRL